MHPERLRVDKHVINNGKRPAVQCVRSCPRPVMRFRLKLKTYVLMRFCTTSTLKRSKILVKTETVPTVDIFVNVSFLVWTGAN